MAHDHPHPEHDHAHHHHEEPDQAAPGEALDAAGQSLADALRLSFRILKGVMIFAIILFVFSGVFIVDRDKNMAVQLRFGRVVDMYREGIHWAWPYPIDEVLEVPIATETVMLDSFWMIISEADKGKDLSDLFARAGGLEPGVDGALLTGDRAIMHLLAQAQYRITDADLYVRNIVMRPDRGPEKDLIKVVLKNACVSTAARTTSDMIWKDTSSIGAEVASRAQSLLDRMQVGISLDKVDIAQSYYPLQVKDAVDNVTTAMNALNQVVQKAYADRQKTLNEAAGEAWKDLWDEIEKLDQVGDAQEHERIIASIGELLTSKAAGRAGRRIQEARQQREQIVLATLARQNEFEALYDQYKQNPALFRQRLLVEGLKDVFAQAGVTKWMLPGGENKQLDLWLNPDPVEFKQAEEARVRKETGAGAGR